LPLLVSVSLLGWRSAWLAKRVRGSAWSAR